MREILPTISLGLLVCLGASNARGARFLFDGAHAQSAGSADWVIDSDLHNITWNSSGTFTYVGTFSNPQRFPTPDQSTVTGSTTEDYWDGALSAWGIDLVKLGHHVETLSPGLRFTYGTTNAQDLTQYDVVVSIEPNILFTMDEKQALVSFIANGGGLFLVSDHSGSDRNNDGFDSTDIWDDFLTNNAVANNAFGIYFPVSNYSDIGTNYLQDPTNPILFGPIGVATNLQYHNGNEFEVIPSQNSTALSLIWWGFPDDSNVEAHLASVQFGQGRVVVCGDSSPFDDGTCNPKSSCINSYTADVNGMHRIAILNASEWLAGVYTLAGPPQAFSITPNLASNFVAALATVIIGTNFSAAATAWLTQNGQPNIVATSAGVSGGTNLMVTFDVQNVFTGAWNVVVVNPDSQTSTLTNGFTVFLDPNSDPTGDGIPTWWKQAYGFDAFDPTVAGADPDGDGMSNLQEYLAGTDPTNPASAFRVTSVAQQGGDIQITWSTGIGKTNALQRTTTNVIAVAGGSYTQNFDSLASGLPAGWTVVTGATVNATGIDVSNTSAFSPSVRSVGTNVWASQIAVFKNLASLIPLGSGATSAQQTNATDRALGVFQSGAFGDPGAAFVWTLPNTSGLQGFNLAFDFMILANNARTPTWTVDYRVGGSGSFTPVGTIGDPGVGIITNMPQSFSFGAALDNQSGIVEIRVAALIVTSGSGSRDTMAIDNMKLTFSSISGMSNSPSSSPSGYTTNFTDIFVVTNTVGSSTNYLDTGAATNWPSSYYRVRLVP